MSWLSTIKNNLAHQIEGFIPSNQQSTAHNAVNDLASALGSFGLAMEGLAEAALADAVQTHLGANAAKIEYDFLHALILKANARLVAIALPTPVPIAVAPPAPPVNPAP